MNVSFGKARINKSQSLVHTCDGHRLMWKIKRNRSEAYLEKPLELCLLFPLSSLPLLGGCFSSTLSSSVVTWMRNPNLSTLVGPVLTGPGATAHISSQGHNPMFFFIQLPLDYVWQFNEGDPVIVVCNQGDPKQSNTIKGARLIKKIIDLPGG